MSGRAGQRNARRAGGRLLARAEGLRTQELRAERLRAEGLRAVGLRAVGLRAVLRAALACSAVGAAATSAQSPTPSVQEGQSLFHARCGMCHLPGGTGTFMLGRRLGQVNALLAERTNLDAAYVKQVVRTGIVSMPRITRAEVTDAELQAITDYLTRKREPRAK